MAFKVGDRVELYGNGWLPPYRGALATVTGNTINPSEYYIEVDNLSHTTASNQDWSKARIRIPKIHYIKRYCRLIATK